MIKRIRNFWEQQPLPALLALAFLVRLVSVIFSKGWGMHDDHFLVIEAAQSWVDGTDYNRWLPENQENPEPTGHSFFYVGIHYLVFTALKWLHVTDPQARMYFIRLIHALFSLITVAYGYRIARKLSGETVARQTGLLLAIFWFFPFLSVRNLVEVACIPFLILGSWHIVRSLKEAGSLKLVFFAGIFFGLAFSIRFQTVFFIIGTGLFFLMYREFKKTVLLACGFILSLILTQGPVDIVLWGYPFAEMIAYFEYNFLHAGDYINNPWYTYLLLLTGILVPPFSLFLWAGFIQGWKRNLWLVLPVLLFLVMHSVFPNKQERFILPLLPFLIILGMDGWSRIQDSIQKRWFHRAVRYSMIFFWIVNLALLPVISTTYSKKARVESMRKISHFKNIKVILMEDTNHGLPKMPPQFYLGQWIHVLELGQDRDMDHLKNRLYDADAYPRLVLFLGDKNLDKRVMDVKTIIPNLEYFTMVEPGFLDRFIQWLNPVNQNQAIYIYKNKDFIK